MLIFPELFLSFSSLSVLIVMEERVSTEVAVPQMISVSKRPLTIMLDTILEEEYYDLELIKPCCRQFSDQLLVMILTYHVMVRSSSHWTRNSTKPRRSRDNSEENKESHDIEVIAHFSYCIMLFEVVITTIFVLLLLEIFSFQLRRLQLSTVIFSFFFYFVDGKWKIKDRAIRLKTWLCM